MTRKDKLRLRNTYLAAARKIAEGKETYSCAAVSFLGSHLPIYKVQARELYACVMSPRESRILQVYDIHNAVPLQGAWQDFRVLLLCMMAAACGDFADMIDIT